MESNYVIVGSRTFLIPNLRKWNFWCAINSTWIRQMISIPTFTSKMCHFCHFKVNSVLIRLKIFTKMMKKILPKWKIIGNIRCGSYWLHPVIEWAELKDMTRGELLYDYSISFDIPHYIPACKESHSMQGFYMCQKSHPSCLEIASKIYIF